MDFETMFNFGVGMVAGLKISDWGFRLIMPALHRRLAKKDLRDDPRLATWAVDAHRETLCDYVRDDPRRLLRAWYEVYRLEALCDAIAEKHRLVAK